jgi:hypothetical protein
MRAARKKFGIGHEMWYGRRGARCARGRCFPARMSSGFQSFRCRILGGSMRFVFGLVILAWTHLAVAGTFVGQTTGTFRVSEVVDSTLTEVSKVAPLGVTLTTDYSTMRWSVDLSADVLMAGGPSQSFETRLLVTGNLNSRRCIAPCSLADPGNPSPLSFPNASGVSGAGDFVLLGSADWTLSDRIVTSVRERNGPESEILASGNTNQPGTTVTGPGTHFLQVLDYPDHIRLTANASSGTASKFDSEWTGGAGDGTINLGRITDGNNYLEVTVRPVFGGINLQELLPGDFSTSGAVDAGDYVFWRKAPGTLAPFLTSYDVWRSNYGNEISLTTANGVATTIPEPSTLLLALCGVISLARRVRVRS